MQNPRKVETVISLKLKQTVKLDLSHNLYSFNETKQP